jgi:hypothetical protein
MLLDRIDIDSHGPLARIGVGPFSQQLNVVHTAAGSGKTALVRFLRDSLTGTTPAYGGMSKSSGRVVWAAADGLYHCRREPDGTTQGRRFVEFEGRLGGYNADRFNRPSVVIDLPPAIVDGIVTDTVMTSVRRVIQSVVESGLDRNSTRGDSGEAARHQARVNEIAALRNEISQLRDQLRREGHLDGGSVNEAQIRDRLSALTLELGAIDSRREFARQTDAAMQQRRRDRDAMTHAVGEVDRLRRHETDLRKRIASLETTLARLEAQSRREDNLASIAQIARKRVNWIDQHVDALRRVLADVRGLGDLWFSGRSLPGNHWRNRADSISNEMLAVAQAGRGEAPTALQTPLTREELAIADRGWLAGRRIDGGFADGDVLGTAAEAQDAIASQGVAAEIEARLDGVCRCVDRLVGRLEAEQQHWLAADQTAEEMFGDAMTESEQAIRRSRRRGEAHFENGAQEFVDDIASGSSDRQSTRRDSGWVEDSVRRQRIDSLHRAERRRKLDDLADSESSADGTEDAILATMRGIGTALHSISRRLRGLKINATGQWTNDAWLAATDLQRSGLVLPIIEQADAVRRCERELVATLVRLVNHRGALVRRVSSATAQDAAQELNWLSDCETSTDAAAWADHSLRYDASAPEIPMIDSLGLNLGYSATGAGNLRSAGDVRGDAELTWTIGDGVLNQPASAHAQTRHLREATRRRLEDERNDLVADLKQSIGRMNQKLTLAEQLRSRLRTLPVVQNDQEDEVLRGRVEAEINRLHRLLAAAPSNSQTVSRYRQSVIKLRALEADMAAAGSTPLSPLAALASSYLQRLSAGRLHNVSWHESVEPQPNRVRIAATIDSRGEEHFDETDRFLAALAVRLAAGDELAHRGRPLPLVIETPAELSAAVTLIGRSDVLAYDNIATNKVAPIQSLRSIVAVLAEASARGRQIVLLTHDRGIADTVVQFGGRGYGLDGSTYFAQAPMQKPAAYVQSVAPARTAATVTNGSTWQPGGDVADSVNRDFDIQWRETHGIGNVPTVAAEYRSSFDVPTVGEVAHVAAAAAPGNRAVANGGSTAGRFETIRAQGTSVVPTADFSDPADAARRDVVAFPTLEKNGANHDRNGRGGAPSNPFFLTGDSPIEQSPSIDALAAVRLRALDITTISQLLASSPQELADRVQMADINAATIRRWQSECRLVCGVRGLRGFDARVLVGCGLVHPREIAEVEPSELVEKVEAFLATDRGAAILRTGTSHEVARLTEWIAEARRKTTSGNASTTNRSSRWTGNATKKTNEHSKSSGKTRVETATNRVTTRSSSGNGAAVQAVSSQRRESSRESSSSVKSGEKALRFYLQRQSPVVDAPSIGPRMAERLHAIKIHTVDDLLKASAATIAKDLKLKKVDETLVRSWQQQSKLVCRVPMLRGHDAQLLVAAGITEPERLAQCDPKWLLSQVDPIVQSKEGQSIIRGGAAPDLTEVTDWVRFAQSQRELKAA